MLFVVFSASDFSAHSVESRDRKISFTMTQLMYCLFSFDDVGIYTNNKLHLID